MGFLAKAQSSRERKGFFIRVDFKAQMQRMIILDCLSAVFFIDKQKQHSLHLRLKIRSDKKPLRSLLLCAFARNITRSFLIFS